MAGDTGNVITVTLTANYALKTGTGSAAAKVTISGLTGTQNTASPVVTSDTDASQTNALGTSGAWTQGTGTLVLTAAADIDSGVECVITITVTNPSSDQSSPTVNVAATLTDGTSTTSIGTVAQATLTKATGDKYGISGGLAPLKVVVPTFSTKTIQQSTPVSGASNNEMTVTLTANYDLTTGGTSDATVTITGLAGSDTATSSILVSTCASNSLGTSGSWNKDSGTLILTVTTTVAANTACEITFTLTNPTSDLTSPDVSVEAALTDGTVSYTHLRAHET